MNYPFDWDVGGFVLFLTISIIISAVIGAFIGNYLNRHNY